MCHQKRYDPIFSGFYIIWSWWWWLIAIYDYHPDYIVLYFPKCVLSFLLWVQTHIGCECGRCWSRLGIICCHGWLLMMAGFNPPHQSNRQHPPPRLKCLATLLTSTSRVPLEIDLPKHTHCARPESSIKRCIDAYNQVPLDTSCFFSDLPHRFKWLDWFYDFILLGYIHFYVCYSATNQIHKQIRRKFHSGKKGEMVRNISRGLGLQFPFSATPPKIGSNDWQPRVLRQIA